LQKGGKGRGTEPVRSHKGGGGKHPGGGDILLVGKKKKKRENEFWSSTDKLNRWKKEREELKFFLQKKASFKWGEGEKA